MTSASGGGSGTANAAAPAEDLERSAAAAAAAASSVDAYAMQRYNSSAGSYDTNYAASQYVQSYYGANAAASAYGMTPFLYPHLYTGHHASGLHPQHHGGDGSGMVDDYNTASNTADQRDQGSTEAHAYSQLGGEDESQTGPIRGGYLKTEHGVWRPY